MFRKTMLAVSTGLVFSMSGCGGGGSGDNPPAQITTGTGYYVDSAVSGVKTICGAKEGITDASGKFTFEVGKSCTFFLGDIKLRDIDKAILKDGVTVYETDKYTAQILQSLDSDGNPTNGITISNEFVAALATANITTLPTTEAETTAMLAVIETAGGTIVTETDAQTHALRTLVSGKTYYIPGIEGNGDKLLTKLVINNDATHLTWEWLIGETSVGEVAFSIDGNVIVLGSENQEFLGQETDFINILEHHDDGSTYNARWYEDRAKAEAYLATLSSQPTEFTTALLAGKTFYIVNKNSSNGSSQPETCILEQSYTSTTITMKEWVYHSPNNWTSGCNEDFGVANNLPYIIKSDGKIELQDSEKWWFKLNTINNDSYQVTDPDGISNWYFTKEKANEVAGS